MCVIHTLWKWVNFIHRCNRLFHLEFVFSFISLYPKFLHNLDDFVMSCDFLILELLEEQGISYQLNKYWRFRDDHAPWSWLAVVVVACMWAEMLVHFCHCMRRRRLMRCGSRWQYSLGGHLGTLMNPWVATIKVPCQLCFFYRAGQEIWWKFLIYESLSEIEVQGNSTFAMHISQSRRLMFPFWLAMMKWTQTFFFPF